tara:strand:- start:251 stop:511 length:261 start_codon:yes stop_codon:yes gene_type:complete
LEFIYFYSINKFFIAGVAETKDLQGILNDHQEIAHRLFEKSEKLILTTKLESATYYSQTTNILKSFSSIKSLLVCNKDLFKKQIKF